MNSLPYITAGPVGEDLFVGREPEARAIAAGIRQRSFIVVGGVRMGKTSLLGHLHRSRLPAAGCPSVLIDCSAVADCGELFRRLETTAAASARVVLLDGIDRLLQQDRETEWRLCAFLRAAANRGEAQFVVSGRRGLWDSVRSSRSPLMNLGQLLLLGPLDVTAVQELLTLPSNRCGVSCADPVGAAQWLHAFTAGHPNLVQRACLHLARLCEERTARDLSLDQVRSALTSADFIEDSLLNVIWGDASPLERLVSMAVATNDEGPQALSDVMRLLQGIPAREATSGASPGAAEVVADALRHLSHYHFVLQETRDGYAPSCALVSSLLTRAHCDRWDGRIEVCVEVSRQREEHELCMLEAGAPARVAETIIQSEQRPPAGDSDAVLAHPDSLRVSADRDIQSASVPDVSHGHSPVLNHLGSGSGAAECPHPPDAEPGLPATTDAAPGGGGQESQLPFVLGVISDLAGEPGRTASEEAVSQTDRPQGAPAAEPVRPLVDSVHFSVTAPQSLGAGEAHLVDVWAHADHQREAVLRRAREELGSSEIRMRSQGPARLARGTEMGVMLRIPGLCVSPARSLLVWTGDIANAGFVVTVPPQTPPGPRGGQALVQVGGVTVLRVAFVVSVAEKSRPAEAMEVRVRRYSKAFASYARENLDAVMARIQGIQKVAPQLDVFVDVARLHSGENWRDRLKEEILARDVLYLFWSEAASRSKWVEWEWQCGYQARGIQFIEPVPLAPPDKVPPPRELADLHFDDWVLAFIRG